MQDSIILNRRNKSLKEIKKVNAHKSFQIEMVFFLSNLEIK